MRTSPGRLTALAIGLPLFLAAGGWQALTVAGLMAHGSRTTHATYPWRGGLVEVHSHGGSIHVAVGPDDHVVATYAQHFGLQRPTISATPSAGGAITLTAGCRDALLANDCDTDITLLVPAAAPLSLDSADGGIQVTDAAGDLTMRTGDGSVIADGLRSRHVHVTSGDGGITLGWAEAPEDVDVHTADGHVTVVVPSHTGPYQVDAHTADGPVSVHVPTDPNASARIFVRSNDGGIEIR
jgi:hypothetical protein